MNRRGFLQAILAAGVAPAFVGSSILMPVRGLIFAPEPVVIMRKWKNGAPSRSDPLGQRIEFEDITMTLEEYKRGDHKMDLKAGEGVIRISVL